MPTTWGWRVAVIASILVVFGNAAGIAAGPNVVTVSWAAIAQSAGTLLIVFVAWHVVVQVQTLAVTNFTSPWLIVPAMGLAFAGLFAGGVIFALLRLRTRNLAAAVVAHWLFDAGLITGLFFLTRS